MLRIAGQTAGPIGLQFFDRECVRLKKFLNLFLKFFLLNIFLHGQLRARYKVDYKI